MPYSESSKKATYKYREAHPEQSKAQGLKDAKLYYERNRLAVLEYKRQAYQKKKATKLAADLGENESTESITLEIIEK